jgi:hypothetical protein
LYIKIICIIIYLGKKPQQHAKVWFWGGKYRRVPPTFRFPKCKVHDLWGLWWNGFSDEQIGPFKNLDSTDVVNNDKSSLSKARSIIKRMINNTNMTEEHIISMDKNQRCKMFEPLYVSIIEAAYGALDMAAWDKRRLNDISYVTLYDALAKNK